MTFARIQADLAADDIFDILLELAEKFSNLPRESWGYSQPEIDRARQAMPALTKGLAGPNLPAVLAQWYATIGRVRELTASQNRLHAPGKLELLDDVVIIYTENQACAYWGIRAEDLARADPPVIYTEGSGWNPEADTLSLFALKVGLSELCLCENRFFCAGWADDTALSSLRSRLRLLPVQALQWPAPEREASFLFDDRVLVAMEAECFSAVSLQPSIENYLSDLASPGRIEITYALFDPDVS